MINRFAFGISMLELAACSKSDDKSSGSSAGNPIPSMVAIAKAALPSTLESTAAAYPMSLQGHNQNPQINFIDANLSEMQTRLFSPGPTDFLYRLKMVDSRLTEIGAQIATCAASATTTYTPPAVATGFTFPMEFSCKSIIDASAQGVSDFKVYYGKANGYWYLGEFQTNANYATSDAEPPSMAVLAKVSEDGNNMEVFQISVENSSSTDYATVTHIKADKSAGVFEVSSSSSADSTQTLTPGANFTGLGCGVQMKTDGTLVYASGKFSQAASCPASATVCAAAADLTTTTGCTAPLTTFSVLSLDRAAVSGAQSKSMIIDRTNLPSL